MQEQATSLTEKMRPLCFDDMTVHPTVNKILMEASTWDDCPHLLLYGPKSCGKLSRAMAFIKARYNVGFDDETETMLKLDGCDEELKVKKSSACTRLDAMTMTRHLDHKHMSALSHSLKGQRSLQTVNNLLGHRTIMIQNAHMLSNVAQQALRKIMETHSHHLRFILITDRIDSLLPPVQSRCMRIRFNKVTNQEAQDIITSVAWFSGPIIQQLIRFADGNLSDLMNALDLYVNRGKKIVAGTLCRKKMAEVAHAIIRADPIKTPALLSTIRTTFYDLLLLGYTVSQIVWDLLEELTHRSKWFEKNEHLLIECAAECELNAAKSVSNFEWQQTTPLHVDMFIVRCLQLVVYE